MKALRKILKHIIALLIISIVINISEGHPKNVLMIVADDLGWNDVSWHNPEVIMPNLARLASEGLIMENNYVLPTCSPSRSALLTGYYPIHTGLQYIPLSSTEPVGLPTKFRLLPEYLKGLGYSTHMAGKWHLGFCAQEYLPTSRGFDSYRGLWLGRGDHEKHSGAGMLEDGTSANGYDFHYDEAIDRSVVDIDTSQIIADTFIAMLDDRVNIESLDLITTNESQKNMASYQDSNPFFFYAAFQDVHSPLQVQEDYESLYSNIQDPARRKLLGMVTRLDTMVGRMVDHLKQLTYTVEGNMRSVLEDTIIIFTSDNGGQSDGIGYAGSSNIPLSGRKGDLLEGGCRVPGFIFNSGRTGVTSELFHMTDWLPSVYAGFAEGDIKDLPNDLDGMNQVNLLTLSDGVSNRDEVLYDIANFESTNFTLVQPEYPENPVFSGCFGAALRYGAYKLILGCSTLIGCSRNFNSTMGGNMSIESVLLYNLEEDPAETNDLANDPTYYAIKEDLAERIQFHYNTAVSPLVFKNTPEGFPKDGEFVTGWCEPIVNSF